MHPPTSTQMLARAKVNLCLHVTGKTADGYHLLDSLVVFPNVGDVISVTPADRLSLQIDGPFASGLSGSDNIVIDAAKTFENTRGAAIKLTKNLPVASGIGGGSSDAATTLHLLAAHWEVALPNAGKILALGADVPVCMLAKAQHMQGIGEVLAPVPDLPDFAILLVNPGVAIATKQVFSGLAEKMNAPMAAPKSIAGFERLCDYLKAQRNDLQSAAMQIEPEISHVIKALQRNTDCRMARMSGSGATCFGLFETLQQAQNAAEKINTSNPGWWVRSAMV
ncbi:MAG: 4-(cytidine 5'-diphospho)-2-C-methyl-D-erythritol kinase [Rhodobacteraceae bacterium]|nr:4-(cytidine 5'-diphospho)-2-C-methyl-D-erythritol kinase [Paracoccaceae bacterium]